MFWRSPLTRFGRWMGGVGLLVLGAAAFAAGEGVIDFTPRGTQPGLVHDIQSSGNCAGCHSGGALETYYPAVGWQGSMMANSSRDPLFWAALDVANADGEALGLEGIGEFCLRCHTPEGWFGGGVRKDGSGGIVDGANGCRLQGSHDQASLFNNDYAGIGCHTCHRMQAQGPQGEPGIRENADFWLDDQSCPNGANEPCVPVPTATLFNISVRPSSHPTRGNSPRFIRKANIVEVATM